ncbi:hypothetical protein ABI59_20115 [Acidobacteria bacterium Mor1]|nr:hypothetical protein ABI59_20115 [Acidobacteria bacterium Mor1]
MSIGRSIQALSVALALFVAIWIPAPCPAVEPAIEAAPAADDPVREAIARSLPWLEQHGSDWLAGALPIQGGNGCVSCHHVGFAVWSHREAGRAGVHGDGARIATLEKAAFEFLTRPEKAHVLSAGPLLAGRPASRDDANEPLRATLIHALNDTDGWWRTGGQFRTQNRSIAESDAVNAMWTLLALSALDTGDERLRRERSLGVERLEEPDPELGADPTIEWMTARYALESVLGRESVSEAGTLLLAAQNGDGGWGWHSDSPSNAFNTGQALYALSASGETEVIEAAREFLLESQLPDGTWPTPSMETSHEPNEGKDYIYRYWGTAWAAIGLSRSLSAEADADGGAATGAPASGARHTFHGRYFAGTPEAAGAEPEKPVEAIFTAAGANRWSVTFHFDFQGTPYTFAGSAAGNLTEGPFEGEVLHTERDVTYLFRGRFVAGRFQGEHFERKTEGDALTGTLVLW